uniref:P-type ATPase C-terminal domain-containing protein n=1 Tax=Myotis myotis TaxID=51298 RepID=A0A7J7XHK5_MYOMY|nr:hypothetical protein mMyoMyo1_011700 [Myotis myotis]
MALASRCQAIICCWVLANQKTLILALVKKYQNLAIGLQRSQHDQGCEHHVGVVDQEGMQAVHANPVLLPEAAAADACVLVLHASLQVPMLLHLEDAGSMMVQMWFTFYSGCISQLLYEGWFLELFNLLYIIFPGLCIGLFMQDMCKKQSLELAELYITGLSL